MSQQPEPVRPLYAYVPDNLHNWLDEIKEKIGLSKSDSTIILLKMCRKYFTIEEIEEIAKGYILLNEEGINLKELSGFKQKVCNHEV